MQGVDVIDIVQKEIERLHALHETRFQAAPFVRRNDARNDVERNQALGAAVVAVDGERDADAMEEPLGFFALLRDAFEGRTVEPVGESAVMRPDGPVGRPHFVIG